MDNQSVADDFSLLSKLMEIHGENSFKAKSYSIAAFHIERLTSPLDTLSQDELFNIRGIGEAIGKKILEALQTGELRILRDWIDKTPSGILELMQIKGLGPKKVALVWKELGIESLGELLYACNENRLTLYKGFGAKSQANIKENIEFFLKNQDRFLYADIEPFALECQSVISTQFPADQTELSGNFRRQGEIIDELEWCTTIPFSILQPFLEGQGFTLSDASPERLVMKGARNLPLIWHQASRNDFGSGWFKTTAAPSFLAAWETTIGTIAPVASEEDVFLQAGVSYITPPRREMPAVIAQARQRPLTPPLQTSDIKGIIHAHSDWSDGAHTLEKMALSAKQKGLEYLVISDHSKSAFYAGGLSEEKVKAQHEQIDYLNERLYPFKIFKSIESDILNDGRLDYSDAILGTFDLVIASVHSNLRMSEEKAMLRLTTALHSPFTTILGHPTGRLLLSRKGYPLDHVTLLDCCREQGVVMELNAHPRRLDMDWQWLEDAINRQVLTSIDPDAHSVEGFEDVRYGVLVAQKAGLMPSQNLSSFTLVELEGWLAARRIRKGI